MTRIQLGRGGWVVEVGGLFRAAGIALMVVGLALGGCSSKKNNAGAGAGANGSGGLGDNGLGGTDSSLNKFAKGTMGGPSGPLSDIHFGYNDATIQPQDNEILKSNADYLTKNASTRVQIEGHCDDRGSEEYNIALGARRAQAAKDYLSTLGIAADRMSTISYGKELPLCSEETEDCWAQNRRDHFAVSQ